MLSQLRFRYLCAILLSGGFFFLDSRSEALTEKDLRKEIERAKDFEKQFNWEKAREIYEALLSQRDYGLKIRDRYQQSLRRCWQIRRHQDTSYRKEVLSIEYGQAIRLYNIISNTLLDGSVDKKKHDPVKLFRKGVEELDAALADPIFLQLYLPMAKPQEVDAFRALLRKTSAEIGVLSRKEAVKQIGEVAMAAEVHLQLSATVVTMEFACGACYAIDEYTAYLTPNQLRELAQSLSRNEIVGVGLKLALRDNKIVISHIETDSEADRLNPPINASEHIVSVDSKAVHDLSPEMVAELLKGPVGTSVVIELMSPNMNPRTLRLQRRLTVPGVSSILLESPLIKNRRIGYLKITGFTESTVQEVDSALANLNQPQFGMKGMILDLRLNNGGVFDSAIETARRFLAKGIITSTLHNDPKYNFVYHAKNPNALTLPLIVLVDGDTASAAEVLAGALKDNNRALLIGQTTFGKGCTQCVLKLPSGLGGVPTGGLKVTVARFFSPKGIPYSGRGIAPHIVIDDLMQSESEVARDPYLDRAIIELNRIFAEQK